MTHSPEEEEMQQSFEVLVAPVAKVKWVNGMPVADPDPIPVNTHGHAPQLILWIADKSVDEITSIVIDDPSGEFTQPVRRSAKVWTCTDRCRDSEPRNYKYTITARGKDEDDEVVNDPIIRNQDTGP